MNSVHLQLIATTNQSSSLLTVVVQLSALTVVPFNQIIHDVEALIDHNIYANSSMYLDYGQVGVFGCDWCRCNTCYYCAIIFSHDFTACLFLRCIPYESIQWSGASLFVLKEYSMWGTSMCQWFQLSIIPEVYSIWGVFHWHMSPLNDSTVIMILYMNNIEYILVNTADVPKVYSIWGVHLMNPFNDSSTSSKSLLNSITSYT